MTAPRYHKKMKDDEIQRLSVGDGHGLMPEEAHRGRGAVSCRSGRFEADSHAVFDDGWENLSQFEPLKTKVFLEKSKTILTKNASPDLPFNVSINPYRGCEHGCSYCYARPCHAYMGLSPGLDFETKIFAKPSAAHVLERELSAKNYRVQPIAMGTNTDPYQPIEKKYRITRSILELLHQCHHPVGIVTKSPLILRDIDLLHDMAKNNLVRVGISITSLDNRLARTMEPRAATPSKRLKTIEILSKSGVPVTIMASPMIPALNDHELDNILKAGKDNGALSAGYILLRLPAEVSDIFREWLQTHYPNRYHHVMNLIRSMRLHGDNDSEYGLRQRGSGQYAQILRQRFKQAVRRLSLNLSNDNLNNQLFVPPKKNTSGQLNLF